MLSYWNTMHVNLTELAQSVLLVFFCWNDVVSIFLSTLAELVECLCKFEDLGSATGSNFGSLEFGVVQPDSVRALLEFL